MNDNNALVDRAPETHSGMEIIDVTIPRDLAIDAMQDVLDLANTTLTDEKYIIATRMSLDALKEVPQLRAQLAAMTAERDAAEKAIETILRSCTCEVRHQFCVRCSEPDGCDSDDFHDAIWRGPQGAGEGENEQTEV